MWEVIRLAFAGLSVCLLLAASASGSVQKGDGPNLIATGYGSVWVGTGAGSVLRIDPRARRVVQRFELSFTSVQGLVPAYGRLWVATGTGLPKWIDPKTGRVAEVRSPDACTSESVAVAAGAVWVLDFHHKRLCRIDVSRRVWIDAGEPLTLRSDSSRLWLSVNVDPRPPMVEDHLEHVRLVALDAQTGAPLGPTIETSGWVSFSSGYGSLWAADPIARTLARIDRDSGRVLVRRADVDAVAAPSAGFGALWLPAGTTLQRLDPDSLAVVAELPVAASAIAVGAGGVWVLSGGTVTKVDPRTNRVVGRPIPVG